MAACAGDIREWNSGKGEASHILRLCRLSGSHSSLFCCIVAASLAAGRLEAGGSTKRCFLLLSGI